MASHSVNSRGNKEGIDMFRIPINKLYDNHKGKKEFIIHQIKEEKCP